MAGAVRVDCVAEAFVGATALDGTGFAVGEVLPLLGAVAGEVPPWEISVDVAPGDEAALWPGTAGCAPQADSSAAAARASDHRRADGDKWLKTIARAPHADRLGNADVAAGSP